MNSTDQTHGKVEQKMLELQKCLFVSVVNIIQMSKTPPYYETQGKLSLYCGLHSVNNILGYKAYSKQGMDNICYNLSADLINPHKHIFGGEYDANVLINALQDKGMQVDWHDKRVPLSIIYELNKPGQLMGFLMNSGENRSIWSKLFATSGRHWFVVKKIDESYYLLDPSAQQARLLGGQNHAESWINQQRSNNAEILVVRKHP